MSETLRLQGPISAPAMRYIKLGEGGGFAAECLQAGELGLAFEMVPHDLCTSGDWDAVKAIFRADSRTPGTASGFVRELRAFYEDEGALWVTFADGKLWWAFAERPVRWEPGLIGRLPRRRKTLDGWRSTDVAGAALLTRKLRTRLTCMSGFKRTICDVADGDYLLRKLNAEAEPIVTEALEAARLVKSKALPLVKELHHKEFELLVDLIFAASGWRRVSILGETEKDLDLLLEQTATGERAFVQVKSRATPNVLRDYVERFHAFAGCDRMFFICHSPSPKLVTAAQSLGPDVELWSGETIAQKAVRAGLFDWLIERTA